MDLGVLGGFSFDGINYSRLNTQIAFASDFDSKAVEIYDANFEHAAVVADIRELSEREIPDHDIMTGGFPCQSFSVAATNPPRLGYNDLRGQLFFEMIRILKEKQPRVFIAENVKGLLSANKRQAFPLVLEEFRNAGYHVKYKVLNASHFGVPQKRERVFLVGFREESAFNAFEFPEGDIANIRPLAIALQPSNQIEESFFFSEKAVAGMKTTKNSQIMNKGRAQSSDSPCNTVGAHLAKVSLNSTDPVFMDGGRYRMFTPREVARIQSFPDDFNLQAPKSVLYRGLGNAVAPVVMWHVTKSVISALKHSQDSN